MLRAGRYRGRPLDGLGTYAVPGGAVQRPEHISPALDLSDPRVVERFVNRGVLSLHHAGAKAASYHAPTARTDLPAPFATTQRIPSQMSPEAPLGIPQPPRSLGGVGTAAAGAFAARLVAGPLMRLFGRAR